MRWLSGPTPGSKYTLYRREVVTFVEALQGGHSMAEATGIALAMEAHFDLPAILSTLLFAQAIIGLRSDPLTRHHAARA